MADPLTDDSIDRQDWYEQALLSDAPKVPPRVSTWSDEDDFDDEFDDDFEEELEDEYEIEPADDGALGDADIEEINTDEEEPL